MIECQHAAMERSIVAYLKACDWDRTRCDSLRVSLPFFTRVVRFGKTLFSRVPQVNSFKIPGFVEFSMKHYRSARPKDGLREDGSCNLILASRRIKVRTKPTV